MLNRFSRRSFLQQTDAFTASSTLSSSVCKLKHSENPVIRQVIAAWPFMNTGPQWSPEKFVQTVKDIGVSGVELLPVQHWHLLKKYDLICAASRSHTYVRGMNNLNHHPECLDLLRKAIDDTSLAGFPNVMTFTGLNDTSAETNGSKVSPGEGMRNCILGYKKIVRRAEKKNVVLILEPLNSKVNEAMKGHPGYGGDHLDYCIEIIKAVGSPSLQLLFDVYHIQIMDGNIIQNIKDNKEFIRHVQIAGVPGRHEIGRDQEINYKAVMQTLADINYEGYVGHEWIPKGDALSGLKEGVEICTLN